MNQIPVTLVKNQYNFTHDDVEQYRSLMDRYSLTHVGELYDTYGVEDDQEDPQAFLNDIKTYIYLDDFYINVLNKSFLLIGIEAEPYGDGDPNFRCIAVTGECQFGNGGDPEYTVTSKYTFIETFEHLEQFISIYLYRQRKFYRPNITEVRDYGFLHEEVFRQFFTHSDAEGLTSQTIKIGDYYKTRWISLTDSDWYKRGDLIAVVNNKIIWIEQGVSPDDDVYYSNFDMEDS